MFARKTWLSWTVMALGVTAVLATFVRDWLGTSEFEGMGPAQIRIIQIGVAVTLLGGLSLLGTLYGQTAGPQTPITKRLVGWGLLLLGGAAIAGTLLVDYMGASEHDGIGPLQQQILIGAAICTLLGLSLIPLGKRPF